MRKALPVLTLFLMLTLFLIPIRILWSQPTYTTVADTLYSPVSGVVFTGTVQISLPIPASTSSSSVTRWLYSLPVRKGVFSVALVPNDAILQVGTVYLFHFIADSGPVWDQYCTIPTSVSPVKPKDVCSNGPYSPPSGIAAGGVLGGFYPNPTCPTCVIRGNNLSDLTSLPTARSNLGVASATGVGASGSWPISITGNAATATSATSATSATTATSASQLNGGNVPASAAFVGTNGSNQLISNTGTTATALLDVFSSSLKGLAPSSGGGTAHFLRADGTWATPPSVPIPASASFLGSDSSPQIIGLTATQATAALNLFTPSLQGLAPASGGGTTAFLRADGAWSVPPAASIPSVTHILAGNGLGGVSDSKVTVTSPATAATIAFSSDNESVTIPGGTLLANTRAVNTSSPLTGGGALSSDLTMGCQTASGSQPGCLTSTDWNTFNGKQASGAYITAITGDMTAAGPGSVSGTVTAVNGGSFPLSATFTATNSSRQLVAITGTQATAALNLFTSSLQGLTPASPGGTTSFLRADGTWVVPGSGTTVTGTANQISVAGAGCTGAGTCNVGLVSSPIIPGHPTIEGVTSSGATGNGPVVFGTSPSFTTPVLGDATATTLNKLTVTAPATGSTLTIDNTKTFRVENTLTFAGTDGTTITFPTSSSTIIGNSRAVNTSSPLTGGGALSSDLSLGCQSASGSQSGCLSSTDWTTFNGKQGAGNYITAVTGDVTASGPGSVTATTLRVNGVAFPASPSTNTIPVVTGTNTVTYEAVPNAALANSLVTTNGQACTLGSTCNVNASAPAHSVALNQANGNAITGLAVGTNGRFLLDQGAGADPNWSAGLTYASSVLSQTGTSGNSTLTSNTGPTGFVQTSVEPSCKNNPSDGNVQAAWCQKASLGANNNPADYGNLVGPYNYTEINGGRNSEDNTDKKTVSGRLDINVFRGSGQRAGHNISIYSYGVGDAFGSTVGMTTGSYTTASGDEGNGGYKTFITQVGALLKKNLTGVKTSTCNTTLTASVAKSGGPTDLKTVSVASTAGCHGESTPGAHDGDWVTVDNGVFECINGNGAFSQNACGPPNDQNVDTVQLVTVAGGNITALFQAAHSSGAPVVGSPVLLMASGDLNLPPGSNGWGQGQIVTDLTATPYSTGAIVSIVGSVVTGNGSTNWTNVMVGGDADLPGVFEVVVDNFAQGPFAGGGGPLVSRYPIQTVTDAHHLILSRQVDNSSACLAGCASYAIRPAARVAAFNQTYGATGNTITGIILESNAAFGALPSNSTHLVEQNISPYSTTGHIFHSSWLWYGPTPYGPALFKAQNLGYQGGAVGFSVEPAGIIDDSTHAGYVTGVRVLGNTANAQIQLMGQDLTGTAITLRTYIGDPKKIAWTSGESISPDLINHGMQIDGFNGARFTLFDNNVTASSVIFDWSGVDHFTSRTLSIPNGSGTIFAPPGNSDVRTLPSNQTDTVAIGTANSDNGSNLMVWVCSSGSSECANHFIAAAYAVTPSNTWVIVPPDHATYQVGGAINWQLEALADAFSSFISLRLRAITTAGQGETLKYNVLVPNNYNATNTWTPSSTVTTGAAAPTTYWPGSVITQAGGVATIPTLAGSGTRPLVVDPSGNVGADVALAYRVCDIPFGDTSGSVLTNAQLGPQSRVCMIPASATIVEMDVNADAGTPSLIIGRNHAGTISNIVSSALITAASGGIACANTGGSTGINGVTTCSGTLQNTSLAAGDYLEAVSGTAGGTAKFAVVHIVWRAN